MGDSQISLEEVQEIQARIKARVSRNSPVVTRTETHSSLDVAHEGFERLRDSEAFSSLFVVH